MQGALPELLEARRKLETAALAHGRRVAFKVAPYGGVRTQADTAKILKFRDDDYAVYLASLKPGQTPIPKERWRKIAEFGRSYHNYGAAFDAEPVAIDGV